jgi:hypothetical protein
MRRNEIEARVYQIIDWVQQHKPIEDDRVELKGIWIDAKKAARLVAGHANASRGEPILWVFGVDEKQDVTGVLRDEFSNWYSQFKSQFDEDVSPDLVAHINVPSNGETVVALYFLTDRAPYVVKNLAGGAITAEVPWRQGTSTFSARRSQLLRLLAPLQSLPDMEILRAWIVANPNRNPNSTERQGAVEWQHFVEWYIVPKSRQLTVFPRHRCHFFLEAPGVIPRTEFSSFGFEMEDGPLVQRTAGELLVNGPGRASARCYAYTDEPPAAFKGDVVISVELWTPDSERPARAEARLPFDAAREAVERRWQVGKWPNKSN